ncbi:hypothetical protein AS590_20715 [Prescottella equi]|uniref:hypothetical protein n=1 Tax=Rhodococcus TaxID=1827 RepID=UPI0007DAF62D|nr:MULTISPECIES: hypothetical protein [Rhodococcus]OCC20424.1 hypothetical protein AS590_20715 [Prescottella equi]UXF66188.1 hypothetical protein N6G92_22785 [Rhodococcus qingshengii]
MSWVDKELSLAALTGAVTGVAVMIPIVGDGAWSWVGLFIPAFIGALAGLIVGSSAVAGGRCALRTSHTWPARTVCCWKHRFAACSALAVTLLVIGVFMSAVVATGDPVRDAAGFPMSLIVLAVIAAVTYVFSYLLAPAQASRTP